MVRATFKMRSWARALRPSRVMAFSSSFSDSVSISQTYRMSRAGIWAFE